MIKWIQNIANYYTGWRLVVRCWVLHFLLGFFVGSLAYWLTWTILSQLNISTVGVFSIHTYCVLVSLCWAVLSHILEDFWLNKF